MDFFRGGEKERCDPLEKTTPPLSGAGGVSRSGVGVRSKRNT